jgi:hypothetical protein
MNYGNYINNTVQQYGGDLARQTKYSVNISLPQYFKTSGDKEFPVILNVLAKNFSIPNIRQDILEFKYQGHSIPLPGRTNFEQTFSLTFYLDDKHTLRSVLDEWIRSSDLTVLGDSKNYLEPSEKFGSIEILAKDFEETTSTRKYIFLNVFPLSISGPEFSSEGVSSIVEVTVEFSYAYFITKEGDKSLVNMFEDAKNALVDTAYKKVFGAVAEGARSTTKAVIDLFKK